MKFFDDILAKKLGGGTTPTGTINITQNGETDVTAYATANVQVPQPQGKINITQNATDLDIVQYATADVQVHDRGDINAKNTTFGITMRLDFDTGWKVYDAFSFPSTFSSANEWSITNPLGAVPSAIMIYREGNMSRDGYIYGLINDGNSTTSGLSNRLLRFDDGSVLFPFGSPFDAIRTAATSDTIYIRGGSNIVWAAGDYKLALR
ncbi:MAG: hypothetical protein IIZ35_00030 [Clostridia bacterium]|nr:hypothetical protein [Clostridia bacterium]